MMAGFENMKLARFFFSLKCCHNLNKLLFWDIQDIMDAKKS